MRLLMVALAIGVCATPGVYPTAVLGAPAPKTKTAREPMVLPTPRKMVLGAGQFLLRPGEPVASDAPAEVADMLSLLAQRTASVHPVGPIGRIRFHLSADSGTGAQGYRLTVSPDGVDVTSTGAAGLFYGSQTLLQLVRPVRNGWIIPAVTVDDSPAMGYRGVMVDISRGLVPNVDTFERIIRSLARLKINVVQPYIEDTFAFQAFPYIGRDRGAWTPDEVRELVGVAKAYHVDLSPCFESLGHMGQILKHPELADLRETGDVITPAKEASYKFLGTCYKELADAFPFPYLNVGCDETGGLGQGPSKALADRVGVGKVYSLHLQRLDELCRSNHRTMQFWGDMMLAYPGIVADMPKDAIVMNWDYGTQKGFGNIGRYQQFGYQQIVCPGIESWSGMFTDVDGAEGNIRGFIREGRQAHVLGVLNTAWRDNGEVFFDYDWYAEAIGAEASWADTPAEGASFDEGFSRAFFGSDSPELAHTFRLLSDSLSDPGLRGAGSTLKLYYSNPFDDLSPMASPRGRAGMTRLTHIAESLQTTLQRARPTYNSQVLPYVEFGAERIAFIPRKYMRAWEAASLYNDAYSQNTLPKAKAANVRRLREANLMVASLADETTSLRDQYAALWRQENKIPGLQNVLNKYQASLDGYAAMEAKLATAIADMDAGKEMPSPTEIGLRLPAESGTGYLSAVRAPSPAPWAEGAAAAMTIHVAAPLHSATPVQVALSDVDVPRGLHGLASVEVDGGAGFQAGPAQIDRTTPKQVVLTFVLPPSAQGDVRIRVRPTPAPVVGAVRIRPAAELKGGYWIENSRYRALLGEEGAHLYRWDVADLNGQDITEPGDDDWHGFDDVGTERNSAFKLTPRLTGPLCVQVGCQAPDGFTKTLTFFAGEGWWDTRFDGPVDFYWHYDDTRVMGKSSGHAGSFRYADGRTGPLPAEGAASEAGESEWAAKFRPDGLTLGLISPESRPNLHVGPGGGMGGVGVEGAGSASHVRTYADISPEGWKAVSDLSDDTRQLQGALVTLYARR